MTCPIKFFILKLDTKNFEIIFGALWNIGPIKFDLVMFIESIFNHNHIQIFFNSAF